VQSLLQKYRSELVRQCTGDGTSDTRDARFAS
jgi:hypothetical protein